MNPLWRRRLNLALLALCLGLGLGLLAQAWHWLAQAAPAPTAGGPPPGEARATAGLERDPFAPPGERGGRVAREEPLEALGVVVGEGETLALVRHGSTIRRLRPGESVGRFQLKEVRADRLIFQTAQGEQVKEVPVKRGVTGRGEKK